MDIVYDITWTQWSSLYTIVRAISPSGNQLGNMCLKPNGEISSISVKSEYRRRGVATALYRYAFAHPEIPDPKHSAFRTHEGDLWAHAVGGELPENTHIIRVNTEILI